MQYLLRMILLIAVCFPVGYLFLVYFGESLRNSYNRIFVSLAVVLGIVLCTLAMLLGGLLGVSFRALAYVTPVGSILCLIYLVYKGRIDLPIKSGYNVVLSRSLIFELCSLLLSAVFFSLVAGVMEWSPPGDPASLGTLASLFLLNDKVPVSFEPISPLLFNVWQYPPQFIVATVFTSIWTGFYPGESMLLLGALVSVMIPVLISVFVYSSTNSPKLATASFMFSFMVPGFQVTLRFRDLLFHNLYNGTFPNHLSNLLLILLFLLSVLKRDNDFGLDILLFLVGVSVVLVYYPYYSYVFIIFFLRFLSRVVSKEKQRWVAGLFFIGMYLLTMVLLFTEVFPVFLRRLFQDYFLRMSSGYRIRWVTLSVEYALVFLACLFVVILLFRQGIPESGLMLVLSLVMIVPTVLSVSQGVFDVLSPVLWFFPTRRAWAAFYGVSLAFLFMGLKRFRDNVEAFSEDRFQRFAWVFLLISLVFVSGTVLRLEFGRWQRPIGEDRQALEWIVGSTDIDDLVLNDRSFIGLDLTSFRAQSVVNELLLLSEALGHGPSEVDFEYANRSLVLNRIFDEPDDYEVAWSLLSEYGVDYIFVGSDPVYLDYWYAPVVDGLSNPEWTSRLDKFTSNEEYFEISDANPYLDVVFTGERTRVYSVRSTSKSTISQDSKGM